jgi:hypothetical protein
MLNTQKKTWSTKKIEETPKTKNKK